MTPSKSRPKPAAKSHAGLTVAFLLLAAVAGGYILWPKPAEPVAPKVAALPAPVAPPAAPPQPEPPPVEEQPTAPQGPQFGNIDQQQMAQQMTDQMYGDIFAQMNLTAEQQAKVTDLMGQRMQAIGDVMRTAFQNGGPGNFDPQAIQQQVQAAQAGVDRQIQATVGAANFQQIQARDQELQQQFGGGGGFGPPAN